MKNKINKGNVCFFLLLLSFLTFFTQAQETSQYKLGADDVISVNVFDEPDLSIKEIRISSAGTIAMPLIGQVVVKGKTVSEAEKLIHSLYINDYLKKPNIAIAIIEYRQFYVNGEVRKPGGYSYRDGMTVERAITLAGGFTERASKSSIFLVSEGEDSQPNSVNLGSPVKPGDVITVNESFF